MSKTLSLKYASLNCNSLVKQNHRKTQSAFIRYLRLQQFDILSLQETHASESSIQSLNIQLQAKQTFWTEHCGIVSFSPTYVLTQVSTAHIFTSDRFILCQVQHPHQFYAPFYLINIYAPSSSQSQRRSFFASILDMLTKLADSIDLNRLIVSGDFNYDYHRDIASGKALRQTNLNWVSFLQESFYNCMLHNGLDTLPTFKRSLNITSSIDYIYVGSMLQHSVTESEIEYIQPRWSDHAILSVQLKMGNSKIGPGLWRANPAYVNNPKFRDTLSRRLHNLMKTLPDSLSTQEQWESVKEVTKAVIKQFGIKYVSWRKLSLKQLERKRNRLLRSKPPVATLVHFLPKIENMIHILQQELVDIAALKAGVTWREKGERSAGYLKNLHQQRTIQQYIPSLRNPNASSTDPGTPESTNAAVVTDDSNTMELYAQQFYQTLYTTEPVSEGDIDSYLDRITFEHKLNSADQMDLMQPIRLDDLITQSNRTPKTSSPGADGLSYPYLTLLFNIPHLKELVQRLYNDALQGLFPDSWKDIRVRLLPKKGDLSSLQNHRPISLINCDAKVFTRLITQRIGVLVRQLLNPYQSGFVPGKFIGDNGLALSMILDQAKGLNIPGVGILLDQEKAYDRVHAGYLGRVMQKLNFPSAFINCVQQLFFGNKVRININGFFTDPITQQRGLRQGDPLSPLLFNLALEPFLLSILQDQHLHGYISPSTLPANTLRDNAPGIKCLAYADDVCVLLQDHNDLHRLKLHMDQYAKVSNAKFNDNKSEAFSLNGKRDPSWEVWLKAIHIKTYYYQGSVEAFRYLGYYLPYSTSQRSRLEDKLLALVKNQCQVYSQRQLSIRGRAMITNTLILTKIWYPLRLFKPTKKFFASLKTTLYQFVWQKKTPRLRKDIIFATRESGGLQVLDPTIQHQILQKRWLNYLIDPTKNPSFIYPFMLQHLSLFDNSSMYPHLPLYDIDYRKGAIYSAQMSIWSTIFSSFDYYINSGDPQPVSVPVDVILTLPLHKVLQNIDETHWTRKHRNFVAGLFFTFDTSQQRLRPKIDGEYTRFPRLCRQLLQNILVRRTITLKDFVWRHILEPPTESSLELVVQPLISYMSANDTWTKTSSKTVRIHLQKEIPNQVQFPSSVIKQFWSCLMYPQARDVFYRSISSCIPTYQVLQKFGTVSSATCPMCSIADDTLRHFLVDCPPKWEMWLKVLTHYYPHISISPEMLYSSLRFLHIPRNITKVDTYFIVLSTTLWKLWNIYWPLSRQTTSESRSQAFTGLLPQIISLTDRLLNPPSMNHT